MDTTPGECASLDLSLPKRSWAANPVVSQPSAAPTSTTTITQSISTPISTLTASAHASTVSPGSGAKKGSAKVSLKKIRAEMMALKSGRSRPRPKAYSSWPYQLFKTEEKSGAKSSGYVKI